MKRLTCYATHLAAALLLISGCSTSHPSASNRLGTVLAHLDAPPMKVTDAAVDVCKDMQLTLIESASTEIDGKVVARTAQGSRINVAVNLDGVDASRISIREGVFGDVHISLTLLERIEKKLGLKSKPMKDDDDEKGEAEEAEEAESK